MIFFLHQQPSFSFLWLFLFLVAIDVSHGSSSSSSVASLFSLRKDSATATTTTISSGGVGSSSRRGVSRRGGASKRSVDDSTNAVPLSSSSFQMTASGSSSASSSIINAGTKKVACGLYIWNAPSALLHKWCTHLLRECIYEGRGGVKFVRIEPGSILQLLYPSLRHYSPDSCVLCGGTYQDHLALAWAKHLYTPLDRRLDDDYKNGRLEKHDNEVDDKPKSRRHVSRKGTATTRRRSSSSTSSTRQRRETRGSTSARRRKSQLLPESLPPEPQILYAFHRQYVVDATDLVDALRHQRQGKKKRQRWHSRLPPADNQLQQQLLHSKNNDSGGKKSQTFELRKNSNYYNLSLQSTRSSSSSSSPYPTPRTISSSQASMSLPSPPKPRNLYYLVPVPATITNNTPTSSGTSRSRQNGGDDGVDQTPPSIRNNNKKQRHPSSRLALFMVLGILLGGLDNLIELEALDNAKEKERQRIGKGILLHRE
jgi:hypothetical protein